MNKKLGTGVLIISILIQALAVLSAEIPTAKSSLSLSLNKKTKTCEVFIEWPDSDKINVVYSSGFCALGNAGGIINVSGGIAVAAPGVKEAIGKLYSHSCYPSDYADNGKPVLEIFADGKPVLKATDSGTVMTGELATAANPITAKEVKAVLTGTLKAVDMNILEEKIFRADAPRMLFAHIQIKYTKEIMVNTLYHQMIQANPSFINGNLSVLGYGNKGTSIIKEGAQENLRNGLFYVADNGRYVGFLSGTGDYIKFRHWVNGNYIASYKILAEKQIKKTGDISESYGISCWGNSKDEAADLLDFMEKIRLSNAALIENAAEKAVAEFIKKTAEQKE